jgi:hypothetical protein
MKMKNKLLMIIVLISFFEMISCIKNNQEEEVVKMKPGYFILTELKKSDLKSANEDSIKTVFSLGDIKASKEYYFILSNGGDNSIYDIEFETDNSFFTISPEKIGELASAKNNGSNLIPLISLNVIHGTQLNGVGYADLLPMNNNSAKIFVSGKIVDNVDTLIIKSTFTFHVNAKVMDVRIFDNDKEIDIKTPTGSVSSNLGGLGFIRYYEVSSGIIKISNIGNVNITCINHLSNEVMGVVIKTEPKIILIDSTIDVSLTNGLTIIELESNGTITDDERIQLGNNGKGYIGFYNTNTKVELEDHFSALEFKNALIGKWYSVFELEDKENVKYLELSEQATAKITLEKDSIETKYEGNYMVDFLRPPMKENVTLAKITIITSNDSIILSPVNFSLNNALPADWGLFLRIYEPPYGTLMRLY